MTQAPVRPSDSPTAAEQALLDAVSIDEPWALVERFSHLTREAGTADELTAMRYVADRLRSFGVAHTLHMPTLLISLPRRGSLVVDPDGERRSVTAKTPAFSLSTGDRPLRGELVYLPTGHATSVADFFASNVGEQARQMDIRGKVVITEGRSAPQKVADLAAFGPLALIFVNPGEKIHEGICTTIWGSPDLDSLPRLPQSVVLTVNKPEGTALIEQAKQGGVQVEIETVLETGWRPCPVLVAEIPGSEVPDEFVLLHGHLDSWHVGISDNATGDATMLEVARLLGQPEHRPKRSVRIAWWTGHSQGRYAGSTWYADAFGVDLAANCVAQVNCDSTGSRWATEYYDVTWMPECEALGLATIRAATGQSATGERPLRAGDYAFNNIGVSGVLMLSSSIPREKLKALGYHVVGGSGGNIAWHTEDDTIELADRDNLLRDTRLYALRPVRSPLLRPSLLMSLPRGTKMFQFPRLPPTRPHERGVTPHDGGRVAPFGYRRLRLVASSPPRFAGCPRPSSAPSAEASTVRLSLRLARTSLPSTLPVPGARPHRRQPEGRRTAKAGADGIGEREIGTMRVSRLLLG